MNYLKLLSVTTLSLVYACAVEFEKSSKQADVAVLNQNNVELYEGGQAGRIAETQVDLTVFEGEVILQLQAGKQR